MKSYCPHCEKNQNVRIATEHLECLTCSWRFDNSDNPISAAQNERIFELEDVLRQIYNWTQAYPIQLFSEPDMEKANELLRSGGIWMDQVAGHILRHTLDDIAEIAKSVLVDREKGE